MRLYKTQDIFKTQDNYILFTKKTIKNFLCYC